jgi:hypothetical protein
MCIMLLSISWFETPRNSDLPSVVMPLDNRGFDRCEAKTSKASMSATAKASFSRCTAGSQTVKAFVSARPDLS